jgi:hypothetical protein
MLLDWKQTPAESGIAEELLGEWHHVRLWLWGHVLVLVLLLGFVLLVVGWDSLRVHWWAEESVDHFEAAGCEAVCAEGGVC